MNALIIATAYWILQVIAILMLKHWLNRREERLDRELVEVFQASLYEKETHVWRLRYASWRRIGAWFVSFFAAVVVFAILIVDNWSSLNDAPSLDLLIFGPLFCAAGVIAWYFVAEANGTAHVITERGIARRSPVLKNVFIDWNEIQEISYSSYVESFVIRGTDTKMTISTTLENIHQFAQLALRRVPTERRQAAGKMLERAEKGPFRR